MVDSGRHPGWRQLSARTVKPSRSSDGRTRLPEVLVNRYCGRLSVHARLAGWGVLGGLVGAFALSRVMASQLFGVSPTDPWIFGGVAVALASVAMLATYLPALRASRIDPVEALQGEGR